MLRGRVGGGGMGFRLIAIRSKRPFSLDHILLIDISLQTLRCPAFVRSSETLA